MTVKRFLIRRLLRAVLPAFLGADALFAATYVKMGDAELFDRSPIVVEGRIEAIGEALSRGRPAIDYQVAVKRWLKGEMAESILTLRVPGGVRKDGVGLWVRGVPRFSAGDRALFFLEPRADKTFALHHLMLGAFRREELDGEAVAVRDLGETLTVGSKRAGPADGERDFDLFRRWLIDRAAGHRRAADYFLPAPLAARSSVDSVAEKFVLVTSSDAPPPLGCGANGGHPIRWFAERSPWPVPWRFQVGGQPGLASEGLSDFLVAMDAWADDPMTPVRYLYIGRTGSTAGLTRQDGINAIIFEDPNQEIGGTFTDNGVLALGGAWFLCDLEFFRGERFHPIVEADIVTQDGVETFFRSNPSASKAAQELFAHELGHTLGFAHSPHRESLMRARIHNDGRGAAFDVDDLAAAYYLYGPEPSLTGPPPVPLTPPASPSDLSATIDSFTDVELRFTDNSENESNFRIERRKRGELNFSLVATVPSGQTRYVDPVEAQTTYTYRVLAQNAAGKSLPSELLRVETPIDLRPRAPSNLRSTATSKFRVRLTWQDNSDDEDGFAVEIQQQNAFIELPVTIPPNVAAVELFGLTPQTPFTFRVLARNAHGDSAPTAPTTSQTFDVAEDCVTEGNALCLAGGRFKMEVFFAHPADGQERGATVVPVTAEASLFYFFHEENPELFIRTFEASAGEALDIAHAGLSDVEYRLRVTDRSTGEIQEFLHTAGRTCLSGDAERLRFPLAKISLNEKGKANSRQTLREAEILLVVDPLISENRRPGEVSEPWRLHGKLSLCRRDEETLCVGDGRFAVTLDPLGGEDPATAHPALAVESLGDSGFFSFNDPAQPDVVFKFLDGRGVNGHFWVFSSAALPGASYRLTVVDLLTGAERRYEHPKGDPCGVTDTLAFPSTF